MNSKITIIGLSSPVPQCGKDTVGAILVDNFNFLRVAFADELKRICKDTFKWNGKKDADGRNLLINIGVSARSYNNNFWVEKVADKIAESVTYGNLNFVITDFRFLNEVEFIKPMVEERLPDYDVNFTLLGITRKQADKSLENDVSQKDYRHMNHDYVIINDFDELDELKKLVFDHFDTISKK